PIRCSGGSRLTGRCLVRRRLARSRPTAHQRRRARTGLCGGGGAASGVPLRWPCPDSGRWLATGQRVRNDGGKPPPRSEDLTMPKKPSQPWRLVLTTPSVPVYTKHRSKPAAYRAIQEEKERIAAELSNVVRIAVDQWDVEGQRWVR